MHNYVSYFINDKQLYVVLDFVQQVNFYLKIILFLSLLFNEFFFENKGFAFLYFERYQVRFNRFKCEIRMVQRFIIRH
jgi:hypothetical protein